jgi:methylated-DNA-[protein]-cysteine S-methyltransferase
MSTLSETFVPSPLGPLRLVASDTALVAIHFPEPEPEPGLDRATVATPAPTRHPILDLAARELAEYFAGDRHAFTIPLAAAGTPFQRAVWAALAAIPYGELRSYAQIAAAIGRPRAVRAVGAANGRNPLPIVVPCHRVIGADGTLTGFGGGLPAKRWLLDHERAAAQLALPVRIAP